MEYDDYIIWNMMTTVYHMEYDDYIYHMEYDDYIIWNMMTI